MSKNRQAADQMGFEERARQLLGALLPHRQYEEALARFEEFEKSASLTSDKTDDTASIDGRFKFEHDEDDDDDGDAHVQALMIVGESGTGKSSLLTAICRRPEYRDNFGGADGDLRPIVRLDVPDLPTPKEVVREIFAKLHSPAPKQWTRGQVSRQLRQLFRDLRVKYLQMDEAHVFVQNLTERQIVVNARFLKFMLVSCRVPIILAGEEPLEDLLRHKALERRMQAPIRLGPYLWGSLDEVQEWMALAGSLAEKLGFVDSSLYEDLDLAMRLYLDTRGIIGLLAKRITEAGRFARLAAAADLDKAHLSMAWRRWAHRLEPIARDPFAIVDAQPEPLEEDPYSVGSDQFKALWIQRFHSMAPEERSTKTRRGKRAANTSTASFGR